MGPLRGVPFIPGHGARQVLDEVPIASVPTNVQYYRHPLVYPNLLDDVQWLWPTATHYSVA